MSGFDASIAHLMDAYKAAAHARDVEAFMLLYDPGARVFDAWGTWSYEGATAWRTAVESWFDSLGNERVEVSFDEIQVSTSADFAAVTAIVTYAGLSATGVRLRSMQNRITWVLALHGQSPRIVHEHTSAPVAHQDMKAILQRVPVP
jgi:ketosteroid isomerase-like protein